MRCAVTLALLCCILHAASAQLACNFTRLIEPQAMATFDDDFTGAHCYQIFPEVGMGREVAFINLTITNYTLGSAVMAFYDLGPITSRLLDSVSGASSGEVQLASSTGTLWIIVQPREPGPVPLQFTLRWRSSPDLVNTPSFALFIGLVLMLLVPFAVLLVVTLTIRKREARRVQQLMRDAEQGTDNPIGKKHRAALPKSKVVGQQLITVKPPPTRGEHVIMWISIGLTTMFFVLLFTGAFAL